MSGEELPEGWQVVRVGDACRLVNGRAFKPSDWTEGGLPIIRIQNLNNPNAAFNHFAGSVDSKFLVRSGELLFAWSGTPGTSFGAHIWDRGDAILNQHIFRVLDYEGLFEKGFLRYAINDRLAHLIDLAHGGAGLAHVTKPMFEATELTLPPLAEQRRIVDNAGSLLDQVKHAKGRLERVPGILKRFRQSVLAAACSGELTREWRDEHPNAVGPSLPESTTPVRRGRRGANLSGDDALLIDDEMPELPQSWRYVRLDRLSEPGTIITYGIVLPGPEIEGGVPYVRGQDVEDGWLRTTELRHTTSEIASKHEKAALREGDVLLCIIRNLRVAIVPKGLDGANITQGMVRIRPNSKVVHREFVATYLKSPNAQGWMKRRYFGMDMPRINVEDARAVPVALPPVEEQSEIVRQVNRLFALADSIERRVQAATARAEKLPQSILAKAFSGELVPTEAELARAEGRTYETAEQLLKRVHGAADKPADRPKKAGRGKRSGG